MSVVNGIPEPIGLTMAKWAVDHLGCMVIPAYCNRQAEKYPLIKGWQNSGSRDHGQLEEWWSGVGGKPYAFPGLLGGKDSGLLVIDADGSQAVDWLRSCIADTGGLPNGTFVARTPGRTGGVHLYFRWPGWLADMGQAKVWREGWDGAVELRGRGTWTLMAGSKRPDGEYEILQIPEGELAEAPQALMHAIMMEATQSNSGGNGDLRELTVEEAWAGAPWRDNRKNAVAGLAWSVAIRGASEDETMDVCSRFAQECCEPPLDLAVVKRKVEYTWQRANAARERVAEEVAGYSAWMKQLQS